MDITQYSNRTYTANNLGSAIPTSPNGVTGYWTNYRGIQIHEAGNFLAELTGITKYENSADAFWKDPKTGVTYNFSEAAKSANANVKNVDNGNIDNDSGQRFELCVMKEYIRLTGYKD